MRSYTLLVTNQQTSTYKAALKEARADFDRATKRLGEITHESTVLQDEINRLRGTITALAALCTEAPGLDDLGITESCMEVMESQVCEVTTADVVGFLEARGFDIGSQKNAPASVHAVLSRLARKGKIVRVEDENTNGVQWRGPNYDPDAIPF